MSSYLIALAVFDFPYLQLSGGNVTQHTPVTTETVTRDVVSRDAGGGDVTMRVWARPGQVARGAYAARIGPELLRFFARMFNISFPLPKQDMVAVPKLLFNAMENWGLIFFRSDGRPSLPYLLR